MGKAKARARKQSACPKNIRAEFSAARDELQAEFRQWLELLESQRPSPKEQAKFKAWQAKKLEIEQLLDERHQARLAKYEQCVSANDWHALNVEAKRDNDAMLRMLGVDHGQQGGTVCPGDGFTFEQSAVLRVLAKNKGRALLIKQIDSQLRTDRNLPHLSLGTIGNAVKMLHDHGFCGRPPGTSRKGVAITKQGQEVAIRLS